VACQTQRLACVSWQAIIFRNGRATGRSSKLRLYSCEIAEEESGNTQGRLAVATFALLLDAWLPAFKAKFGDSSPLCIAVDRGFETSSFRIQLLGRTREGKNIALPFAYQFEGASVCSRLQYFDRHVKKHQQSRQDTPLSSEQHINFGKPSSAYYYCPFFCPWTRVLRP
jgi:hypothetical protein